MLRAIFTALLFLATTLAATAQDRPSAILVLDASGSMWGQIEGVNKIVIAREVVGDLLGTLPEDQALGLVAYGHRTKGDCGDIELLYEPGTDRQAIADAVNGLNPKGKTPLSAAVLQAAETLKYTEEAATVILVSDGIETCDFDDWKRCFAINVDSIFHGCQKALPLMREHAPGSIVNISSIAGLIASDTMPAYNASKASVWMLSKSIALHCAKNNMQIRCNSVHPTFVDTPILDGTAKNHNLDKDVLLEKLARQIPLRKVGEPNDIADAVVYLASDESKFMTGAELKLDGGISAM